MFRDVIFPFFFSRIPIFQTKLTTHVNHADPLSFSRGVGVELSIAVNITACLNLIHYVFLDVAPP